MQERPQLATPQSGIIGPVENAAGSKQPRANSIAYAKSGQWILETCLLANYRMTALDRGTRQAKIGEAAKRSRVFHVEGDMFAKKRDGTLDVLSLLLKASEHAARDGAATAMNEEVGIAERGELVIEGDPTAIRHFGLEQIAGRDRISSARTGSEYSRAGNRLNAIDPTHFGSSRNSLLHKRGVQRSTISSAPNEIIEWPFASNIIAVVVCVECDSCAHGMMFERRLYACSTQLIKHIPFVTPVFETLEIAVKARSSLLVPFPNRDSATALGKRNRAGKAGRSGTNNRNGLSRNAMCTRSALSSAHGSVYAPRMATARIKTLHAVLTR